MLQSPHLFAYKIIIAVFSLKLAGEVTGGSVHARELEPGMRAGVARSSSPHRRLRGVVYVARERIDRDPERGNLSEVAASTRQTFVR